MQTGNWSLVFFTLLAQASAGTVIIGVISLFSTGSKLWTVNMDRAVSLTATLLIISGLIFSFFHLDYPAHMFKATMNLSSSWMSREILCTLVLIFAFVIWFTGSFLRSPGAVISVARLISSLLAIALVYIITRVYTIPAINIAGRGATAVAFTSSALFSGTAAIWLILRFKDGASNPGLIYLGSLFLLSSIANSILSFYSFYEGDTLKTALILLYLLAISPVTLLFFGKHKNKWGTCGVIIITLGIVAEIFNRFMILNISIAGL